MPNEKITCIGCNKKFQLLLSHLERTKSCQNFYDISSMREEAERLNKEKKARRSRERYQTDPDESAKKRASAKEYYKQHTPEKKAASKEFYKQHAPEKKATMALYYERHREEIIDAKREEYQGDPEKKQAKRDYYSETRSNYGQQNCLDCGETCYTAGDMKRHIDHAHSDESFVTCQICDKRFEYKQNVERHMREIHSGERHGCEKCPATFLRKSDLQEHIKEGTHFVSYHCKQCSQTIVFKSLKGLIDHTIVKQSREERIWTDGTKHEICKSGILVTCKSHVKSTQLKEGEHVLCMPRKDKTKAAKRRALKKEEIINEGLKLATGNQEAPQVELEIVKEKHEENFKRDHCKWCGERIPFSDECCSTRFSSTWKIHIKNE